MAQARSPLAPTSLNTPAITPGKIDYSITDENQPFEVHSDPKSSSFANDAETSPIKPRSSSKHHSPRKAPHEAYHPVPLTEDALRRKEGIAQDVAKDSLAKSKREEDAASTFSAITGYPGMDDTCFSAFSAVSLLDMTQFTRAGQSSPLPSPKKASSEDRIHDNDNIPQTNGHRTPIKAERTLHDEDSPSPTPRPRTSGRDSDETTNLILDFTEQFSALSQSSKRSPTRNARPSPKRFRTQPNLASFASGQRTPSPAKRMLPPSTPSEARHLPTLLDFDIPPAPTPRSIPSITARELEGLKSKFLSEISSLRATISGKTAEIDSLKAAVEDAERRVGEALEQIRDEKGAKESLVAEKLDWQKRDKELQDLLREVKEEIITSEHERQELVQQARDSEKRAEGAMRKVSTLERRLTDMQAPSQSHTTSDQSSEALGDQRSITFTEEEVEAYKQQIAREVHRKFMDKHEKKVIVLKDRYEGRWIEKVQNLERELEELTKENEALKLRRDRTSSKVIPDALPSQAESEEARQQRAVEIQLMEEQKAKLTALTEEIASIKQNNNHLSRQLEQERIEKGDLVAAVEEMLSIQTSSTAPTPEMAPSSGSENLRGSISRGSGLKGPGFGMGSRMPLPGLNRSISGGPRSGIMSNIERMGRGRAVE